MFACKTKQGCTVTAPIKSRQLIPWFITLIASNGFAQIASIIALNPLPQERMLRICVHISVHYIALSQTFPVMASGGAKSRCTDLHGDVTSADQTFRNTEIISGGLQRPKTLSIWWRPPLLRARSNEWTPLNLCGYKIEFWAERKWLNICAQSSPWRVMRITGPLFSSRGEMEPGRGGPRHR